MSTATPDPTRKREDRPSPTESDSPTSEASAKKVKAHPDDASEIVETHDVDMVDAELGDDEDEEARSLSGVDKDEEALSLSGVGSGVNSDEDKIDDKTSEDQNRQRRCRVCERTRKKCLFRTEVWACDDPNKLVCIICSRKDDLLRRVQVRGSRLANNTENGREGGASNALLVDTQSSNGATNANQELALPRSSGGPTATSHCIISHLLGNQPHGGAATNNGLVESTHSGAVTNNGLIATTNNRVIASQLDLLFTTSKELQCAVKNKVSTQLYNEEFEQSRDVNISTINTNNTIRKLERVGKECHKMVVKTKAKNTMSFWDLIIGFARSGFWSAVLFAGIQISGGVTELCKKAWHDPVQLVCGCPCEEKPPMTWWDTWDLGYSIVFSRNDRELWPCTFNCAIDICVGFIFFKAAHGILEFWLGVVVVFTAYVNWVCYQNKYKHFLLAAENYYKAAGLFFQNSDVADANLEEKLESDLQAHVDRTTSIYWYQIGTSVFCAFICSLVKYAIDYNLVSQIMAASADILEFVSNYIQDLAMPVESESGMEMVKDLFDFVANYIQDLTMLD